MTGADVIEINREDDGEITMQKRLSLLFAAAAVALVLEDGNVLAWTKDPDMAVDAAKLAVSGLLLPAPEPTLAESLDTVVGTGDAFVGASDLTVDVSSDPPPGALFVDDDLLDCPNASFTSIQAAVDASGPNDTIKVCPGTYREQVRIIGHNHDGLKLESLKPLQAVIQWPTAETFPLALVYFNNADGVTIRGFTISGPFTFPACSPDRHEGVLVDNAFDERILHNHITLIRNSVPALYGCQEGDAVAIGRRTDETGGAGTTPGSARIEHNLIDEYQKNGVQAVNPGTVAHITHNVIRGSSAVQSIIASNGVVVFREAAATVDHNVISNNKFTPFPLSTGVILAEAPPGSSVSFNQIFDNDFGVQADTETNIEISHNDLFDHQSDAIVLCGESMFGCGAFTGNKIRNNKIVNNGGSGIAFFNVDANLVKTNRIENNGLAGGDTTDGIRVDLESMQNRISENHMVGNRTHDCHDDSFGTGTAGTANLWTNDQGDTENRPGLCR